ncbi:DNA-repair protein, partial [Entamoeba histolytica HM-3:IMSS]
MGIKGLWELIKEKGREIEEKEIEGKRVAIDTTQLIIKYMKKKEDVNTSMMKILIQSREKGIYPIFVFDGKTKTYLKERTIKKRMKQQNKEYQRKKETQSKEIDTLFASFQKTKPPSNSTKINEQLLFLIKNDKHEESKLTPNISLIHSINSNRTSINQIYHDSLLDSSSSPFLFTHTQINHRILNGFYERDVYSFPSSLLSSLLSSDLSLWGIGALSFPLYSSLITSFLSSSNSHSDSFNSHSDSFNSHSDSFNSLPSFLSSLQSTSPPSIPLYQSIPSSHKTIPTTTKPMKFDYECDYDEKKNECDYDYDEKKIEEEKSRKEDGAIKMSSPLPFIHRFEKHPSPDTSIASSSIQPSSWFYQDITDVRKSTINVDIEKEAKETRMKEAFDAKQARVDEMKEEKQEEEIIQEIEEIIKEMKEEKTKQQKGINIEIEENTNIIKEEEEEERNKKEKENIYCISEGIIKNEVIYKRLIQMFKEINIPYIIAPGEAEAQCYQLEHDGLCDYIATNDSDIFVYGAKNVITNLFTSSHPILYSASTFDYSLDQIRLYSLLVPSDYSNGFPNVGPITAKHIITSCHSINDFLISLSSHSSPLLSSLNSHLPPHFPDPLILSQFSSPNVLLSPSLPLSPLPSLSSLFLYSKHSLHWSSSLLLRYFPSFI